MQSGSAPLVSKLPETSSVLRKSFDFTIGGLNIRPEYWQAITIVVLLFLIVWTIARWRHLYVKWNLQGFLPSIAFGFVLTLILEGFLLVGGRTMLTELLGWENAPKPISTALDEGRAHLVEVLGTSAEISSTQADDIPTAQTVLRDLSLLDEEEREEVLGIMCSSVN